MTANIHELEWGRSPARDFFMRVVRRTDSDFLRQQYSCTGDAQGMYVIGPDGSSYAYTNDHMPRDILGMMNRGLAAYRARPPRTVEIAPALVQAPFAVTPAPATSVMEVYARIRPLPAHVWGLNRGGGRDYLWIYEDEVRALGDGAGAVGDEVTLPSPLVGRLLRFHLLDDVRGTPDMWGPRNVKRADLHARLVRVDGTRRTIEFGGAFAMESRARGGRGYTGRIDGTMDIDTGTARVVRLRAVAEGEAWGEGTYTPRPPPGRYHLLVAIREASNPVARVVPPEAVSIYNDDMLYRRANTAILRRRDAAIARRSAGTNHATEATAQRP